MNPFEKMDLKKDSFTKKELILYDVLKDEEMKGGLVKKYGYYGAFLAIQQSIEQRDLGSVGKYYY